MNQIMLQYPCSAEIALPSSTHLSAIQGFLSRGQLQQAFKEARNQISNRRNCFPILNEQDEFFFSDVEEILFIMGDMKQSLGISIQQISSPVPFIRQKSHLIASKVYLKLNLLQQSEEHALLLIKESDENSISKAQGFNILSQIKLKLGHYEKAEQLLKESEFIIQSYEQHKIYKHLHLEMLLLKGELQLNQQDKTEALSFFQSIINSINLDEDKSVHIQLIFHAAQEYITFSLSSTHQFEKALMRASQLLQDRLHLYGSTQNQEPNLLIVQSLTLKAIILTQIGQYEESISLYQQAQAITQEIQRKYEKKNMNDSDENKKGLFERIILQKHSTSSSSSTTIKNGLLLQLSFTSLAQNTLSMLNNNFKTEKMNYDLDFYYCQALRNSGRFDGSFQVLISSLQKMDLSSKVECQTQLQQILLEISQGLIDCGYLSSSTYYSQAILNILKNYPLELDLKVHSIFCLLQASNLIENHQESKKLGSQIKGLLFQKQKLSMLELQALEATAEAEYNYGDFTSSYEDFLIVFQHKTQIYTDAHPFTIISESKLIYSLFKLNKIEESKTIRENILKSLKQLENNKSKKKIDTYLFCNVLYHVGIAFFKINSYKEAIQHLKKGYKLLKEQKTQEISKTLLINVQNLIGDSYFQVENYEDSLKFHEKSLKLLQKIKEEKLDSLDVLLLELQRFNHKELNAKLKLGDDIELLICNCFQKMGQCYFKLCKIEKCLKCYSSSFQKKKELSNVSDRDKAYSLHLMAEVYQSQSKFNDTLQFLQEELQIRVKMQTQNQDIITKLEKERENACIGNLLKDIALLYKQIQNNQEALIFFKESICYLDKLEDRQHSKEVIVVENITALMLEFDHFKEAIPFLQRQLNQQQSFHPYLVSSIVYNLGTCHKRNREFNKALLCFKRSLEIRKKHFSDSNTDVINSIESISSIFYDLNKYQEALQSYQEELDIKIRKYGKGSFQVATTYNNIGCTYKAMNQIEISLKMHQKSLLIKENLVGPCSTELISSLDNIASIMYDKKQFSDALELYERVLNIRLATKDKNDKKVDKGLIITKHNLSCTHHNLKNFKESLELQKDVLEMRQQYYGNDSLEVLTSLDNIASNFYDNQQYDDAFKYYEQELQILQDRSPSNKQKIATTLNNLACTLHNLSKLDQSYSYHQKALDIRIKSLGESHSETISSMNNLASNLFNIGKYYEALQYFQRVLSIRQKEQEKNQQKLSVVYSNIGSTYFSMFEFELAVENFQIALNIRIENNLGDTQSSEQMIYKAKQMVDKMKSVNSLQVQSLKEVMRKSKMKHSDVCIICLDEFKQEQNVKILPCEHFYHIPCIDKWLLSKNSCPNCRALPLSRQDSEDIQKHA